MKKILTLVFLSAILTACSSSNQPSEAVTLTKNPALQQALQTCNQTLGDQATYTAFKKCMEEQEIEKSMPKNQSLESSNGAYSIKLKQNNERKLSKRVKDKRYRKKGCLK